MLKIYDCGRTDHKHYPRVFFKDSELELAKSMVIEWHLKRGLLDSPFWWTIKKEKHCKKYQLRKKLCEYCDNYCVETIIQYEDA